MAYNLSFNSDGTTTGTASGNGNANFSGVNRGFAQSQLASLQTPASLVNAQNQVSVGPTGVQGSQMPRIGDAQLPSWLNANPDANLTELLGAYGNINNAYDPTGQVNARNNAIAYNTSAGTQAANNAATQYANRASQQGGSALGAGVVKAQALMPVFGANNKLQTDAADIAAKAHQEAATLSGQIASTISNLRQSYLGQLTDYATKQQQMTLQNNQFNSDLQLRNYSAQQGVASDAAKTALGYAQTRADLSKSLMSNSLQQSDIALRAASTVAGMKNPYGGQINQYNNGQAMDAFSAARQQQNAQFGSYQDSALTALRGMY